ncbi:MAG: ATP-binding cassette domain-containing protein [Clostridia bacterium]|nr:ATP-binding cassette domain-containing protein [Clostridia bacterium]
MNNIIVAKDLTYGYERDTVVLKDINLKINKGEMIALTGKNGSGKTTLSKHFNGLLKPTKGTILVDGIDTREETVDRIALKVGYVFQNPDHQIFNDTVYKEAAFGPENQGLEGEELRKRVVHALEAVGLLEYENIYPYSLSKGQRQRLSIASVIAMNSEAIVLDEPTTGLDHRESLEIMELLKELNSEGITIIFITHDMNLVAKYGQRMIVLSQGEIIADDSPRNIFKMKKVIERAHLRVPLITELAQELEMFRDAPLDPQEFFQGLCEMRRDYANVLTS